MSRRSVTRSAISPPIWVKRSTNWATASAVARTAGMPSLMRFSAAPSQARSCASVAVAARTSEAEPVALAGTRAQPLGDGGRRGGEPCGLRVAVRLGHLAAGVELVEVGKPAGADDGCVPDAGNHRHPGEDGAGLGAE